MHGETERDTLARMSGALIVDGIVKTAPQVANLPERVLLVRDAPLAGTPLPAANRRQIAAMKWAMHCHILSHEDGGMMAKIRVGTAPPLTLSAPSVTFASATASSQSVTISGGQAPYALSGCSGVANAVVNGSSIVLWPVAAGGCVLTIADSSNPSITANVTIAVNAGAAAITISPNSVSFASTTAASQNVSLSGATAPLYALGLHGHRGEFPERLNAYAVAAGRRGVFARGHRRAGEYGVAFRLGECGGYGLSAR